jgi:hypothetical protein
VDDLLAAALATGVFGFGGQSEQTRAKGQRGKRRIRRGVEAERGTEIHHDFTP